MPGAVRYRYTAMMSTIFLVATSWLFVMLSGTTNPEVHRCIGAYGETVFSGQTCASLGAEVAPSHTTDKPILIYHGCAANAEVLLDRVAAAFATHDVNMLGGLFLWRGMGSRGAYRHMRELGDLLDQPLAGVDLVSPRRSNDQTRYYRSLAFVKPSSMAIRVASDATSAAPVKHLYPLVTRDACVWLSF